MSEPTDHDLETRAAEAFRLASSAAAPEDLADRVLTAARFRTARRMPVWLDTRWAAAGLAAALVLVVALGIGVMSGGRDRTAPAPHVASPPSAGPASALVASTGSSTPAEPTGPLGPDGKVLVNGFSCAGTTFFPTMAGKPDPSWDVVGVTICTPNHRVRLPGQGIWEGVLQQEVPVAHRPAMIDALSQPDGDPPGYNSGRRIVTSEEFEASGVTVIGEQPVFPRVNCPSGELVRVTPVAFALTDSTGVDHLVRDPQDSCHSPLFVDVSAAVAAAGPGQMAYQRQLMTEQAVIAHPKFSATVLATHGDIEIPAELGPHGSSLASLSSEPTAGRPPETVSAERSAVGSTAPEASRPGTSPVPTTLGQYPTPADSASCHGSDDHGGRSGRVDPLWTVVAAKVCHYGDMMMLPDAGAWYVHRESVVRTSDLDSLVGVLNRRDLTPGMDTGICAPPAEGVSGVVLTLSTGESVWFGQPQEACTHDSDNDELVAIADAGEQARLATIQVRTEAEIESGCNVFGWSGGYPGQDDRSGGALHSLAPAPLSVCAYSRSGTDLRSVRIGVADRTAAETLWDSVTVQDEDTCTSRGKAWIAIGPQRAIALTDNTYVDTWGPDMVTNAIFEVGGCHRVYDSNLKYIGTADPTAVDVVDAMADSWTATSGKAGLVEPPVVTAGG